MQRFFFTRVSPNHSAKGVGLISAQINFRQKKTLSSMMMTPLKLDENRLARRVRKGTAAAPDACCSIEGESDDGARG
jgi:hypothetical protein